jgi:Family of unknown function (DUF6988)
MSLLDEITARGAEIRERLRDLLARHEYPADTKTVLVLAYVDTALEHHEAIWLLAKSKLSGSAFAVIRLVYDALLRALWINKVACPEQIEQASRDELRWPKMRQMLANIKQAYFGQTAEQNSERAEELELKEDFQRVKDVWGPSCSYTHSGALQLGRRFTGDEVKPNYSEGEIAEALNLANAALFLMMPKFFTSMDLQREAEETLAMRRQYKADLRRAASRSGQSSDQSA